MTALNPRSREARLRDLHPPPPLVVDEDFREDNRYGLYVYDRCPECGGAGLANFTLGEVTNLGRCGSCGGQGTLLQRIAETSKEGIGVTLIALAEDRAGLEDPGNPVIGVLDQIERRWLSGVWQRGRR